MAHTFIVCDFGKDEEAAQKARLTLDRWKQGFRLDKKLLLKFDREEAEQNAEEAGDSKAGKKAAKESAEGKVVVIVRLDFSEHEKLSHQRWVDRIPGEEVFKGGNPRVIRHGDAAFDDTSKRFNSLG